MGIIKRALSLFQRLKTTRRKTPMKIEPAEVDTQILIDYLKTVIKGRAKSSQAMRRDANRTHGMDKHLIHLRRRDYGADTRYYLLAYAFLKGIPYKTVENQCHQDNNPDPDTILGVIADIDDIYEGHVFKWDLNDVKAWIKDEREKELQEAA
jgi:hypothetical protein